MDKLMRIREKEIQNSEKQIKNNQFELDKLQIKYNELSQTDNVQKLEEQLRRA